MSSFFKICMLITSFLPLWISILFVDLLSIFYMKNENILTEVISIVIILSVLLFSILTLKEIKNIYKKRSSDNVTINETSIERKLTTEYLLSYILPLFAFDFTLWYDCVKFLIYFLSILILCVKNDNVYTNILFELRGYKIYYCKVTFNTEKDIYVITKEPMIFKKGHTLDVVELNKPFYFYQNNKCEEEII